MKLLECRLLWDVLRDHFGNPIFEWERVIPYVVFFFPGKEKRVELRLVYALCANQATEEAVLATLASKA